jgi:hypothetical protein
MVLGTGKPAFCLDSISGSATSPGPAGLDRDNLPVQDNSSPRCVFLTCDLKDCMAFCERCSWVIAQGMCIRPEACRE